jgi:hypothetical protein
MPEGPSSAPSPSSPLELDPHPTGTAAANIHKRIANRRDMKHHQERTMVLLARVRAKPEKLGDCTEFQDYRLSERG